MSDTIPIASIADVFETLLARQRAVALQPVVAPLAQCLDKLAAVDDLSSKCEDALPTAPVARDSDRVALQRTLQRVRSWATRPAELIPRCPCFSSMETLRKSLSESFSQLQDHIETLASVSSRFSGMIDLIDLIRGASQHISFGCAYLERLEDAMRLHAALLRHLEHVKSALRRPCDQALQHLAELEELEGVEQTLVAAERQVLQICEELEELTSSPLWCEGPRARDSIRLGESMASARLRPLAESVLTLPSLDAVTEKDAMYSVEVLRQVSRKLRDHSVDSEKFLGGLLTIVEVARSRLGCAERAREISHTVKVTDWSFICGSLDVVAEQRRTLQNFESAAGRSLADAERHARELQHALAEAEAELDAAQRDAETVSRIRSNLDESIRRIREALAAVGTCELGRRLDVVFPDITV